MLWILFLQLHIFHDTRITFFCSTFMYGNNVKITFRFCSSLWRIFQCVIITLFIWSMYLRFFKSLELRYILIRSNYVWKWRDNYVSLFFDIVTYFLLRCNYVICLFDVVTFSDDVRIRLYFDTFQLCTESRYNIAIF